MGSIRCTNCVKINVCAQGTLKNTLIDYVMSNVASKKNLSIIENFLLATTARVKLSQPSSIRQNKLSMDSLVS